MQLDEILKLLEAVSKSNVDTFSYSNDSEIIKIKKNKEKIITTASAPATPVVLPADRMEHVTESASEEVSIGNIVTSPLVGTFYGSPSPEAESFVKVGDSVKKGQVLCIIEAMKLMNEIESDFDGVVREILVEDSTVVEYGQKLFVIE